MTATSERLLQDMRTKGWACALELIARGLQEDASTCEGEGWINTTAALSAAADNVQDLSESIRRRLTAAEDHDRAIGCD